ncbi:MAG TPA: hypothetical protein VEF35_05770 [Candidatus Bathyarchaeia archaeon]|nr:hypothetical protein [Candidatus Bathyarchaeia archaeon]
MEAERDLPVQKTPAVRAVVISDENEILAKVRHHHPNRLILSQNVV